MSQCYYCGTREEELRPYGPNLAPVCFDCAMQTEERRKQTEKSFALQVEPNKKWAKFMNLLGIRIV